MRRIFIAVLAAAIGFPPQVLAAPAAPGGLQPSQSERARSTVKATQVDVVLTAEGLLHGQVVDAKGTPMPKVKVALFGREGKPVVAETNKDGAFGYKGVGANVYGLSAGDAACVCRVWTPETAPPSAGKAVLLVADTRAVRGQHAAPPAVNNFALRSKRLLANPLAVAGIVAGAVAIPVIISNNDDDPAS